MKIATPQPVLVLRPEKYSAAGAFPFLFVDHIEAEKFCAEFPECRIVPLRTESPLTAAEAIDWVLEGAVADEFEDDEF
jgi:hypothetical protein